MANKNQFNPSIVFHPGVTLEEKLGEMEMSIKEFALRTSKPEKTIIAVIKGDSAVTPQMALLFESITKIPAHMWLNLQREYDEFVIREKAKAQMEEYSDWAKAFPYSDMVKLGWVSQAKTPITKADNLLSFFNVCTPNAWGNYYIGQQLKTAFRISLASTKAPHAISAWLRQGEIQLANCSVQGAYSDKALKNILSQFKLLIAQKPETFNEDLQGLCSSVGIKLVYTPSLTKAPVNGATRWMNDVPCIQLSDRMKRYDVVCFSFMHELGHILLHGKKDVFLEAVDYNDKEIEKEKEADDFASNFLLSIAQENEITRIGKITKEIIIEYAQKFGIHPSIIVGRLQHKGILRQWEHNDFLDHWSL